jgi:putative Holliday junction resolvase
MTVAPTPATPPPPDAPQWRILAVDYGTRRTGLAVTDPMRLIATGLAGVDTARLLPFLDDYTRREPVGLFVVGYPLDLDGRPTHATPAVDLFLRQLANRWPTVPRYRADERFTSAEAARSLAASGLRRKARRDKHLLDEVAATLILQAYLDAHGGHRPPGASPPSPAP